jgi:hypothetical protein
MALDEEQVGALEFWLKKSSSLTRISELCTNPFQDPDKGEFISLHEAQKLRDFWNPSWHAVGAGFLLGALEILVCALANGLWQAGTHSALFSLPPLLTGHLLFGHTLPPLLLTVLIGCLVAAANVLICMAVLRQPEHLPDPVFGRLLQEKLKLSKPLYASTMVKLIRAPRFRDILKRACESTLPARNEDYRHHTVIDQLVNAVKDDKTFEAMFGDFHAHRADEGENDTQDDRAFARYLLYVARRRLFEAVVDDPDLKYIYDGQSQGLDGFLHWLSTIDFSKISELFGKMRESKPGGAADVQGIANLVLLLILSGITVHYVGQGVAAATNTIADPNGKLVADQLKEMKDSLSSALGSIKPMSSPPCCASASQPLKVTVGLPDQWTVKLSNPPIQVPPAINVPPAISISPPAINVTPPTINVSPPVISLVDKGSPTPANPPGGGQPGGGAQPPGGNQPSLTGDAVVVIGSKTSEPFALWNGSAECVYTLTSNNWTEDPLPLTIKSQAQPPPTCLAVGTDTYFVTSKPVFVAQLGIYLSIEDWHKWLHFGKKESVVVRVHAAPMAAQKD